MISKTSQSPPIPESSSSHQQETKIKLILVLAAILYLYKIGARSLWIDELISIDDAQQLSFSYNFNRGRVLYYILLKGWMSLSTNDAWLRGLAVIFALVSVYLLYRLGCYLFNQTTGLIAALLLTVSPVFINHAQEVRYYTLNTALGLAGSLILAHFLLNRQAKNWLWGWSILRFLVVITTPINGVLVLSDCLIVGWFCRQQRQQVFKFIQALLLLIFLCLPGAISVYQSSHSHRLELPVPGIANFLREMRFLTAFPFPPPPSTNLFFQGFIFLVIAVVSVGICSKKFPLPQRIWVMIWVTFPLISFGIFSHLFFSIWLTRYLMLIQPYLLLLVAVGLVALYQNRRQWAWGVVLIYTIATIVGISTYYNSPNRYIGKTVNYRELIAFIQTQEQPQDAIAWAIHHTRNRIPLQHYYHGNSSLYIAEPSLAQAQNPTQLINWLETLPAAAPRLWLVYWVGNKPEKVYQPLNTNYQITQNRNFGGLEVFLLTPKPSTPD